MLYWKDFPLALLALLGKHLFWLALEMHLCITLKSPRKRFWDNSCQAAEVNFRLTSKLGQEEKALVCRGWHVLGQLKHGTAASSCHVCSKTTQLKERHADTVQLMALEGVGILASLDYIVVLNRCLGNFYILNNDSWRQKSAVGMSESWCEKAVITQRKFYTLLLPRTVRSGQGLCWSQIFIDFAVFPAIPLSTFASGRYSRCVAGKLNFN